MTKDPPRDQHARGRVRLWERPLPLQRQDSNRNDFIDNTFLGTLQHLDNPLPEGLTWVPYRPELARPLADFYHGAFLKGVGAAPDQLVRYIDFRMEVNPQHLVLILGAVDPPPPPPPLSAPTSNPVTTPGENITIAAVMLAEPYTAITQGRHVPVLTIGGLAIAEPWRGIGLVISLFKEAARRITANEEHMYLFNLKKDRRLYPCGEVSVWWYPLHPDTCRMMALFPLEQADAPAKALAPATTHPAVGPSSPLVDMLIGRISREYSFLPVRRMTEADVEFVTGCLVRQNRSFSLARSWTESDVRKWLLPRDTVLYSYIVTDETGRRNRDFFSFHVISYNFAGEEEEEEERESNEPRDDHVIKVIIPGYHTSHHTSREDIVRFIIYTGHQMGAAYIHGYGALGYREAFTRLGFVRNTREVHFLQMFNWESRALGDDEIGIAWIQF